MKPLMRKNLRNRLISCSIGIIVFLSAFAFLCLILSVILRLFHAGYAAWILFAAGTVFTSAIFYLTIRRYILKPNRETLNKTAAAGIVLSPTIFNENAEEPYYFSRDGMLVCSSGVCFTDRITRVEPKRERLFDISISDRDSYRLRQLHGGGVQTTFAVIDENGDNGAIYKNYVLLSQDRKKANEEYDRLIKDLKQINHDFRAVDFGVTEDAAEE